MIIHWTAVVFNVSVETGSVRGADERSVRRVARRWLTGPRMRRNVRGERFPAYQRGESTEDIAKIQNYTLQASNLLIVRLRETKKGKFVSDYFKKTIWIYSKCVYQMFIACEPIFTFQVVRLVEIERKIDIVNKWV